MKKAWPEKSTLFYYSICCLHLSRTGKMISGIQFYENGMSNIMQNGGNDAKINRIPPQYYPIGMKMLANFTRRGSRVKDTSAVETAEVAVIIAVVVLVAYGVYHILGPKIAQVVQDVAGRI